MEPAARKWTGIAAGFLGTIYGSFSIYAMSDGDGGFEMPLTINRGAIVLIVILAVGWIILAAVDAGNRVSAERDIRYVVATEVERQVAIFERILDDKLRDVRRSINEDARARSTEDTEEFRVALVQQRCEVTKVVNRLMDQAATQNRADHERLMRAVMINEPEPPAVANGRAPVMHILPNGS